MDDKKPTAQLSDDEIKKKLEEFYKNLEEIGTKIKELIASIHK
jgi:hypothetical protein